ncbi:MAG: GntR family transcriptional regulator [Methanothrix sp.]|nr:GntR family transcriptional regulator [Methanothrix sp.]
MMIVRNSMMPYYYQLYEILRQDILNGTWKPGDMLPTETELLEKYELSRTTVRQSLDMLVNDGLIYRQRGRGTFVSHFTIEQGLSRIISFTEDMRQRKMEPHTVVLSAGLIPAPNDIAEALQLTPGEEVANLERLRLADAEPMSLETSYLFHKLCPGVLKNDYAVRSLRQTLATEYNQRLVYARQKIRAVTASRKQAQILSVEPGAALLFIERISYTEQNVPVEFLRVYHRGDRYTLYNELHD